MHFLIFAFFFLFNRPTTTETYTLSLHDALPISTPIAMSFRMTQLVAPTFSGATSRPSPMRSARSEEHTSELQSHHDLVCRLLLEKKNSTKMKSTPNHKSQ